MQDLQIILDIEAKLKDAGQFAPGYRHCSAKVTLDASHEMGTYITVALAVQLTGKQLIAAGASSNSIHEAATIAFSDMQGKIADCQLKQFAAYNQKQFPFISKAS
ncbi:hypothetical protein [Rufibacter latericius]|uniref:2-isopropylmalate synthase LeuA allosteric (dimerisation) domain-containing protein n=1 Tax=Rufibacter latericius TaxID=2487040 RepID=A0A3M9MP27_9BACT|nr:hypothetical protein [Rufibacter latericius]RNI26593.1 hypothetical protein EFB08_11280 [Rufibacter latericius]